MPADATPPDDREAWLYANSAALEHVRRGLREAAAGEVHDLGSVVEPPDPRATDEPMTVEEDGALGAEAVGRIKAARERQYGLLRGLGHVGPDFTDPLPEAELRRWEGAKEADEPT